MQNKKKKKGEVYGKSLDSRGYPPKKKKCAGKKYFST
jgi:hypothetical protein